MEACEQRKKLLRKWRDAAIVLSEAIADLEIANERHFEYRLKTAIQARESCEDAYRVVLWHRHEHKC